MPDAVDETQADNCGAGRTDHKPKTVEQHGSHEEIRHARPTDPQGASCGAGKNLAAEESTQDLRGADESNSYQNCQSAGGRDSPKTHYVAPYIPLLELGGMLG